MKKSLDLLKESLDTLSYLKERVCLEGYPVTIKVTSATIYKLVDDIEMAIKEKDIHE